MLAAGGLQSLLQHLHQLLLPIITPTLPPPPAPAQGTTPNSQLHTSGGEHISTVGEPNTSSGSSESRGKLAVASEDLETLLAVLEALASADTAADMPARAQVTCHSQVVYTRGTVSMLLPQLAHASHRMLELMLVSHSVMAALCHLSASICTITDGQCRA